MPPRNDAPGALDTIRLFVNTRNIESGEDRLATPSDLATWLTERGLPSGPVTEDDRKTAVAMRESFRALLLANHDGTVPLEAVDELNRLATELGYTLAFEPSGRARPVPATRGVRAALAELLTTVLIAQSEGTWPRLKACRADRCQWAYYDWSKNRSGKWCDMAVCGNRMKARRHRRRSRSAAPRRA